MSLTPLCLYPRFPTTYPPLSIPSPADERPHRTRRSTIALTLSEIETRRRMIQAAEALVYQSHNDFSPEYLASWNDVDIPDDHYFKIRMEEEEKIKGDVKRAMRAQNRVRAQKVARIDPISHLGTNGVLSLARSYSSISPPSRAVRVERSFPPSL